MALSGVALLGLYLTVMAVLIGGFFLLRQKFRKEEGVDGPPQPVAAAAGGNAAGAAGGGRPAGGARPRGALDRMRRGAGGDRAQAGSDDEGAEEEGGADGPMSPEERRRAEKEAARAAREQVRAAQEAAEQAKRAKEDKYAARREAREAEREAAEREAAEAAAKAAEEQRAKDEAEFEQWKGMFTVSDAGSAVAEEGEAEGLLEEFVQTIKRRKVVVLDELAAQFHIKTPDVIARIQQMEADGRLTGVLDDRGKFLCITPEEMDSVARWIQKRGRVTIADLVAESNKLIDLNGTEEANDQLVLDEDEKEQKA